VRLAVRGSQPQPLAPLVQHARLRESREGTPILRQAPGSHGRDRRLTGEHASAFFAGIAQIVRVPPNRLATETSPYLRQHAENPVDWYPWGAEALAHAQQHDKPILLSVGYAACHWCHVMAHESFEDDETAALMNELFVNVKVDREERPDIDSIYMQAVQAMTGHGGWPLTVFLTPDGRPYFGGTYFPPTDRHGMPAFRRVIRAMSDAYRTRRAAVDDTTERLREIYDASIRTPDGATSLSPTLLERAYRGFAQAYDVRRAGFGGAPKFPPSMSLDFLLTYAARTGTEYALVMARDTFRGMIRGGIFDQLGGGLHRYSVDADWLVPHFEKMLYDNALLVRLGVHLWQVTHDEEIRAAVESTIEWVVREMTSPDGGFYSSLDADSEGHEGKFYVWSADEVEQTLGADAEAAMLAFDVTREGNFEGKNILRVVHEPELIARRLGRPMGEVLELLQRAKDTLLRARAARVRPGRDEKIVASWNGLMLRAIAEAGRVFDSEEYRSLAIRNAEFLLGHIVRGGRVRRSHKDGMTRNEGFLEDQAAVALGMLELFHTSGDRAWLDRALQLAEELVRAFWDADAQLFFDTPVDHERLITRPRDITDNATPAGNSLAAELLLRLAEYTGREDYRKTASIAVEALADPMARHPSAFGHLLGVADMLVNGAVEVVLVRGVDHDGLRALEREVSERFVPALILARVDERGADDLELTRERRTLGPRPTAHVCRNYACAFPTTDPTELGRQLEEASRVGATGDL
jgi:uncharacterized protein